MKKRKLPGDNISLKTKKNESYAVMEWLNCQTNLMDSIRYLIENELRVNGVRNLQHFVPPDRSFSPGPYFHAQQEGAAAAEQLRTSSKETSFAFYAKLAEPDVGDVEMPVALDEKMTKPDGGDAKEPEGVRDEIDEEDIDSWL